ncbi:AAA domain-containing protein [Breznakibacter xylanolyticus]|uniref:AAA domain-containing protein n=1 Tax=Breznakibacter xylanolyticus TaxID=990 RepID=A0A2W7MVK8_9BACT|nr:AAA family ATPase [Breznakibacter xylanolyticus]PZX11671.1 AAA domain-containing protein [Breznakibacter xylanolyticus]
MKKIDKVKIQHFKAFQAEEEFNFRSKHVLAYGNNGSGKSSLFWALYTFLQSSIKTNDDEVKKYFADFVESNRATHQTLKNIYATNDNEPHIKLIINEANGNSKTYQIGNSNPGTRPENNGNDTTIQELNLASDFINYKLLHNFYRATHRQEINLWQVFERDIFPFLTEGTKNWLDIIKEKTTDIPRRNGGSARSGHARSNFDTALEALNQNIEDKLSEIANTANDFMKKHFFNKKDVLKVELKFLKKFSFDLVKRKIWEENHEAMRLDSLKIGLVVKLKRNGSENWDTLQRVQSFLNESQLTKIAIGIRIGALRSRVQSTDFKILVLDDMLISLDMSNRMDIIRVLLNTDNDPELEQIFGGFQKIILTHDLGFYELVKRYTSAHDWEYFKFHSSDKLYEAPIIRKDKSRLEKAESFLVDGEYDACGNELRKETEAVLDKYLKGLNMAANGEFEPLMSKLNRALNQLTETKRRDFTKAISNRGMSKELIEKLKTDFENDATLEPAEKGKLRGLKNDLTNYVLKQIDLRNDSENLINEAKDILKRIMNPASHSSFEPLYEAELRKAINGVVALKEKLESI